MSTMQVEVATVPCQHAEFLLLELADLQLSLPGDGLVKGRRGDTRV